MTLNYLKLSRTIQNSIWISTHLPEIGPDEPKRFNIKAKLLQICKEAVRKTLDRFEIVPDNSEFTINELNIYKFTRKQSEWPWIALKFSQII